MKGFVISSNSNLAWLTNSKCEIRYARKKNLKYLICLLFFTYSSTNSKFGIGFAVPTNLITYLTNVEGFVYVLRADLCLRCGMWLIGRNPNMSNIRSEAGLPPYNLPYFSPYAVFPNSRMSSKRCPLVLGFELERIIHQCIIHVLYRIIPSVPRRSRIVCIELCCEYTNIFPFFSLLSIVSITFLIYFRSIYLKHTS